MPHWNAGILFPLMTILNLIVILTFFGLTKYLNSIFDFRILGLVAYGSLILLNYLLFIKNKRYKEFAEAFDRLDKPSQRKKYLTGIFISVFGYVLPIVALILMLKFS